MSKNSSSDSAVSVVIIILSVIAGMVLIIPIIAIIGLSQKAQSLENPSQNQAIQAVTMQNGKQIISITAKGGYWPKTINAKAGIDSILKIKTQNTFDCSSSIFIPSLGVRDVLQPSGTKEVAITPQKTGDVINGTCSMGMYSFQIIFE